MFNQDIYDLLEAEFEKNHIEEDVEEVLLDLSEALADKGIMDKEVTLKESYGKTDIETVGICSEEEDEVTVLIKRVKIGNKEFEIEDYFL
ncbi:U-box domain-containing protein 56 [Lacrimispora sp.]|uniref:U-box domain-containing protein 56 n=1 Tax=Lacrimispora sp. TaxID=2719234 RepID=UPI0028A6A5C6|nr:U-box domain-containing protein 56 [Lacrimispora sp.]